MTLIFFFSSRRQHTRSKRDWSSDVCSSDLYTYMHFQLLYIFIENACKYSEEAVQIEVGKYDNNQGWIAIIDHGLGIPAEEIGRASCREINELKVETLVVSRTSEGR